MLTTLHCHTMHHYWAVLGVELLTLVSFIDYRRAFEIAYTGKPSGNCLAAMVSPKDPLSNTVQWPGHILLICLWRTTFRSLQGQDWSLPGMSALTILFHTCGQLDHKNYRSKKEWHTVDTVVTAWLCWWSGTRLQPSTDWEQNSRPDSRQMGINLHI